MLRIHKPGDDVKAQTRLLATHAPQQPLELRDAALHTGAGTAVAVQEALRPVRTQQQTARRVTIAIPAAARIPQLVKRLQQVDEGSDTACFLGRQQNFRGFWQRGPPAKKTRDVETDCPRATPAVTADVACRGLALRHALELREGHRLHNGLHERKCMHELWMVKPAGARQAAG